MTLQGKAKQKAGAKQAAALEGGGDAWEAAPEKLLRLRVKDVRNTLKERWLQLFWPEDGRWWPGQVLDIRCKERKVHLLYKTGAHGLGICPSAVVWPCAMASTWEGAGHALQGAEGPPVLSDSCPRAGNMPPSCTMALFHGPAWVQELSALQQSSLHGPMAPGNQMMAECTFSTPVQLFCVCSTCWPSIP